MSRTKIKYLECNTFNIGTHEAEVDVKLDTQFITKRDNFKYLGFVIQGNKKINDDITHRIGGRWMNWRLMYDVLYDINVPTNLKGKFYMVVVRPAMLYGAEC